MSAPAATAPAAPLDASVVIPVRDGAGTIGAQLDALAGQTFTGRWEVVVADNGSTDGTPELVRMWADRLRGLRVVDASGRPGAGAARNRGAAAASGALLAFCDADDVVDPGWLAALVRAAEVAPVVGGRLDVARLNSELARRWRPALPTDEHPVSHGFLPYALGANLAVRADAFATLGGFTEDYPVGEDVELTWRAQLAGLRFDFAPDAVVHYRYRDGIRALVRQYVAYGTIGPRLYRDFADAGMPASRLRGAVGPWLRLVGRLLVTLPAAADRGDVLRRLAFRAGRIRGSLAARVVYL